MPRRPLGALAALLVPLVPLSPTPALAEPAPMLVIEGKGFGHGVGMPQDGAYAMAAARAAGCEQVLPRSDFFARIDELLG